MEQVLLSNVESESVEESQITVDGKPTIHRPGYIGYKCDRCGRNVWFPLCPNVDTNRGEFVAWFVYQLKLKDEVRLCGSCQHYYTYD